MSACTNNTVTLPDLECLINRVWSLWLCLKPIHTKLPQLLWIFQTMLMVIVLAHIIPLLAYKQCWQQLIRHIQEPGQHGAPIQLRQS